MMREEPYEEVDIEQKKLSEGSTSQVDTRGNSIQIERRASAKALGRDPVQQGGAELNVGGKRGDEMGQIEQPIVLKTQGLLLGMTGEEGLEPWSDLVA